MKRFRKLMAFCLVLMMALTVAVPVYAAAKFTYKGVTVQPMKSVKKTDLTKGMGLKRVKVKCSCFTWGVGYRYKKKGLVILTEPTNKAGTKERVSTITITKKSFPLDTGVKVGSKLKTLKSAYGSKLKKKGAKYYVKSGSDKITFTMKSGKVKKIVIS